MAITLDVDTRLNDASARKTEAEARAYFERAGTSVGTAFGNNLSGGIEKAAPKVEASATKMQRSFDKAADAAGRLRVEQAKLDSLVSNGAPRERLIAQAERLAKAHRDNGSAVRDATTAYRDFENAASAVASVSEGAAISATNAAKGLSGFGAAAGEMAASTGPAGIAVIAVVAAGLVEVASVAASASQALLLLPAAAGAAGAALGTLALATHGFGDALGDMKDPQKFAQDLQLLSPNAQQAALSIQSLVPAFDQLKNSTQNAFFAGVGPQLESLANQYLPAIQNMTTGIASAFNQMFSGVANQLMTPQTQQAIQTFTANVSQAFKNLAPAVAPLTNAFTQLTAVGSNFLPQLATAASDAAQAFSQFISDASQSGQLSQWLSDGLDTLKQLGSIAWDLGRAFMALAPAGKDSLTGIVQDTKDLANGFVGLMDKLEKVSGWLDKIETTIEAITQPIKDVEWLGSKLGLGPDPFATPRDYSGGGGSFGTGDTGPLGSRPAPGGIGGSLGAGIANPGGWGPSPFGSSVGSSASKAAAVPNFGPSQWQVPIAGMPAPNSDAAFQAQSEVLRAQNTLESDNLALLELKAKGNATQRQLFDAETKIEEDKRALWSAQQKAAEAQTTQLKTLTSGMDQIGAALDNDLGISKGLPGIADNLVRFIANLAAAPLLGQLSAVSAANPNQGSGLVGMLASQGAFGSQYTPAAIAAASSTPGVSAYPSTGYVPGASGTPSGGYPGDAALLANVPAGKYSQTGNADLTKGLGDCSSAVEDLVNIMDGRPTGGRSMSTGNEAAWLQSRGFMPGSMPGAFNVGFNSEHTQATLPGGTPFNWGSDSAAARGGVGGTGAFDPAFTSHYYRPVSAGSPVGPSAIGPAPIGGGAGSPDLYSPANTNPGLNNPGVPSIGGTGTGAGFPGMGGPPQSANFGGVQPAGSPGGGGGIGITPGGTIDTAISAAASAVPGLGAAAQIGMKEASRAIQYAGQVAGIGVSGLMETFLPAGSELAGKSWFSRIAGGIAGAKPALPNLAGGKTPPQPQGGQPGQPGPGGDKPPITVNYTNNKAPEDRAGADLTNHLTAMNASPGW